MAAREVDVGSRDRATNALRRHQGTRADRVGQAQRMPQLVQEGRLLLGQAERNAVPGPDGHEDVRADEFPGRAVDESRQPGLVLSARRRLAGEGVNDADEDLGIPRGRRLHQTHRQLEGIPRVQCLPDAAPSIGAPSVQGLRLPIDPDTYPAWHGRVRHHPAVAGTREARRHARAWLRSGRASGGGDQSQGQQDSHVSWLTASRELRASEVDVKFAVRFPGFHAPR